MEGTVDMEAMMVMAALFLAARVVKERMEAMVVMVEMAERGTMVVMVARWKWWEQ